MVTIWCRFKKFWCQNFFWCHFKENILHNFLFQFGVNLRNFGAENKNGVSLRKKLCKFKNKPYHHTSWEGAFWHCDHWKMKSKIFEYNLSPSLQNSTVNSALLVTRTLQSAEKPGITLA